MKTRDLFREVRKHVLKEEDRSDIDSGNDESAFDDYASIEQDAGIEQYRVFVSYEHRNDLKHSSILLKATSEQDAIQLADRYMKSIAKRSGIRASSIEISAAEKEQ